MQYLVYDPNPMLENAEPSPEMMAEMGKYMAEAFQAGVLVLTGALEPNGTRLRLVNGEFSVTDSASIEANALLGGFAVLKVNSLDEAIEWSKRWRLIVGEGESEIVRLHGPDDSGPA